MSLAALSSRPMVTPSARWQYCQSNTPSLRMANGSRRVRRAVTVNSVSLDTVENSINDAIDKSENLFATLKQVALDLSEKGSPIISDLIKLGETYLPELKKGADVAANTLEPYVTGSVQSLSETLQSSGVDTEGAKTSLLETLRTATSVIDSAITVSQDIVSLFQYTFGNADTNDIGELAVFLATLYLFGPKLGSSVSENLRGYTDDLPASKVVDRIRSEKMVLIDIRPVTQQATSGIPDVPRGAKGEVVTFSLCKLSARERGQLKKVELVESAMTALQISYLKKISDKNTPIVIMNDNGRGAAKDVAKYLRREKFSEVYVLKDGFKGWNESSFRTKPLDARIAREAEILPPGVGGTRLFLPFPSDK